MAASFGFFTLGYAANVNYWVGPSSGGTWSTKSNWVATNGTSSATVTLANGDAYVLQNLDSGAVLNMDITNFQPSKITFKKKADGDSWEMSGSGTYKNVATLETVVPSGCTLLSKIRFDNQYSGSARKLTLSGGGTMDFCPPYFYPYVPEVIVNNSRFVINKSASIEPFHLQLNGNNAELVLNKESKLAGVVNKSGKPNINFNGNILSIAGFYKDFMVNTYTGTFSGGSASQNIKFVEGGFWTVNGDTLVQPLYLTNGQVDLTNTSTFVGNKITTMIDGRASFVASTTTGVWDGDGVHGGIDMHTPGTTLTVTGSASVGRFRLGSSLAGDAKLVLDSAKSAIVLTGTSRHTGGTEIKQGSVTITSKTEASRTVPSLAVNDAEIYLDFENPANLSYNKGTCGTLHSATVYSWLMESTSGVIGRGVKFTGSSYQLATYADAGVLPDGRTTYTISLWMRPTKYNTNWPQVFIRGMWGDTDHESGLQWIAFNNYPPELKTGESPRLFFRQVAYSSTKTTLSDGSPRFNLLTGKSWLDLGWQHLAVVYSNHVATTYLNGVKQNTMTYKSDILDFGSTAGMTLGGFYGYLDEFIYAGRAWTEDEIKAEYNRAASQGKLGEGVNAADLLPEPVAHYEFDDETNPGKDSSPNGYNLITPGEFYVPHGKESGASATYTITTLPKIVNTIPGAIGKCCYFYYSPLVAETFPSLLPQGNSSFTISVRFIPAEHGMMGPSLVGWGGYEPASSYVRSMFGSLPIRNCLDFKADGNSHGSGVGMDNCRMPIVPTDKRSWTHLIWTYDSSTQIIRGYLDGTLTVGPTKKADPFNITAGNFYIGATQQSRSWGGSGEKMFRGYMDDVRIYNVALTPDEVRTLAQSMDTGKVEATLPTNSVLTVGSSATVTFSNGVDHVFSCLQDSGTIDIYPEARVTVGDGSKITTLVGSGALRTVDGTVSVSNASCFAGTFEVSNSLLKVQTVTQATVLLMPGGRIQTYEDDPYLPVTIPEGFTIYANADGSNLPVVKTAGKVSVPKVAYLTFDSTGEVSQKRIRKYTLITGVFDAPNLQNWKYSGADGNFDVGFRYQDNDDGTRTIYAHLHFGGTIFVVR